MTDTYELPPLPGTWRAGDIYTADQMRSYGAECARVERERCASLCDDDGVLQDWTASDCADAIRRMPPPGALSAKEYIEKVEADPQRAEALQRARERAAAIRREPT